MARLTVLIDSHSGRSYSRWLFAGAASGALSGLIVHQGAFALLESPWLLALWGGIWGGLLAAALARLEGLRLLLAAAGFGAVLPTLLAFMLIAPLRGQPTVTGVVPLALLAGVLLNAAWGLCTGIGLALLGRARARPR